MFVDFVLPGGHVDFVIDYFYSKLDLTITVLSLCILIRYFNCILAQFIIFYFNCILVCTGLVGASRKSPCPVIIIIIIIIKNKY